MKKRLPILKEQLAGNWLYKIVALFVALSIWFTTLENKKDIMRSRVMKVKFVVREGNRVESSDGDEVRVAVIGPKNLLNRYLQSVSYLTFDFTGATAGKKMLDMSSADFSLPAGVRLYRVEPKTLELIIKEVQK